MKELYIEIVSCMVKIVFLPLKKNELYHDNKRQRALFIKDISKYLHNFIRKEKPKKVDYSVFVDGQHLTFIDNPKLKIISIPLFKKISKRSLLTYDYLNILQFQQILRDIISRFITQHNGFVIHGSSLSTKNGEACLFLGKSGAGKSTIVRLLKDTYTSLADDLNFIKKEKGKYFVYQTPFIEKQWWIKKQNKKYALRTIFFINKGRTTYREKLLDRSQILDLWLDQILIAKENKQKFLQNSSSLMQSGINCYQVTFRKNKKDLEKIIC